MSSPTKRGMELAVGTVVMLIIACVVLAASIALTYQVLCSAEEYSMSVDSQSAAQIERRLLGSDVVAVGSTTKTAEGSGSTLCGGSSQRTASFTLGIKNIHGGTQNFVINITPDGRDAEDGEIQFLADIGDDTVRIQEGQTRIMTILIRPPATVTQGQIGYTISVNRTDGTIHGVRRIYVRV